MAEAGVDQRVIEPEIADLLADLKRRLFGSRARGDHDPDSDVDVEVAMIVDQKLPHPFELTREILEDTYDLLMETGFHIQPWRLEKGSLVNPPAHPDPQISRAIQRDGIRID